HVNLSVGAAIAVFAKRNQGMCLAGTVVDCPHFADRQNLLALSVKDQETRRWGSQNVQPAVCAPLHRAQSGAYAWENPLPGAEVALLLRGRTPRRAKQQTHHRKNP